MLTEMRTAFFSLKRKEVVEFDVVMEGAQFRGQWLQVDVRLDTLLIYWFVI
jgi:hypothetical protein